MTGKDTLDQERKKILLYEELKGENRDLRVFLNGLEASLKIVEDRIRYRIDEIEKKINKPSIWDRLRKIFS